MSPTAATLQVLVAKNSLGLQQLLFLGIILKKIRKFNLTIKKKNGIHKWHLNFKIRLKQKSKFEIYFTFLKKLKIDGKIRFLKGNLGGLTDQISTWAKKKYQQKKTKKNTKFIFQFLLKFEISNLKFVFRVDN